jgi:arylsulfatase A-like enzyme
LRGFKGSLYEGGIRTPFIVSWPDKFSGNRVIDTPVISLDILPTALDGIGIQPPTATPFDGKSLLPPLAGQSQTHHNTLFWSKGHEGEWAVRRGDWKLHVLKGKMELVNLAEDPSERMDLSSKHPEMAKTLTEAFDVWIAPMADPITGGNKLWEAEPVTEEPTERERERLRRRLERKKQRDAEQKAKQ